MGRQARVPSGEVARLDTFIFPAGLVPARVSPPSTYPRELLASSKKSLSFSVAM